jgi:hypothetical protein
MLPLLQQELLLLLPLLLCCMSQAAVFLLVDLVGTYKVSPEMKKKAQELRLKLEQEAVKKVRINSNQQSAAPVGAQAALSACTC